MPKQEGPLAPNLQLAAHGPIYWICLILIINYSWLWFTRRQVSESIIRFPQLKPLAGPERPFVKSQLLSTVNVSDPSLFRGSGNTKSSVRCERSFGFAAIGVMGIVSGRPV